MAQPIIPASDGTGTIVNQQNNQFNIQGGQLSGDGRNLFHSFEQLGLSQDQIINFLSTPDIENILGRVTGNSVSVIDGLIQITGGNSNLFLINPAGMIFGNNASLNLPASLTITTANSIGFNNGNWFNAIGNSNWQNLIGTPNQFLFEAEQSGTILNLGNLAISEGESLNLIAGNIVNQGSLNAPSGQIIVAAIPGENLVRLSQAGQLLSLDVSTPFNSTSNLEIQPLNLPQLLTGGDTKTATHIQQNSQGELILTDQSQTGFASISGEINVSNASEETTAGNIYILGNHLELIDAIFTANGVENGGNILIGGNFRGGDSLPIASQVLIDQNSIIQADGILTGNGGNIVIFSEDKTRILGDLTARGGNNSGDGGFIETSSKGVIEISSSPDTSSVSGMPGTWLIDPINIEIIAEQLENREDEIIDFIPVDTFVEGFTNDGITTVIPVNNLVEGLQFGNVVLTTGTDNTIAGVGNITFRTNLEFNGIGSDRTLTLNAANDIIINNQDIIDQVPGNDSLNLILNADIDDSDGGSINLNNTIIELGGGNVTANGNQVLISQSSLTTSGEGTISLNGNLTEPGSNRSAIAILNNSQIITENGAINITGINQNTDINNDGIFIQNSIIESINNGIISLTGIGGTGNESEGILIFDGGIIQGNNGNISLNGTANGESLSHGIFIKDAGLISTTGDGTILLDGINNSFGQDNDGILLLENTIVETLGSGDITIEGNSNAGERNQGVSIRSDSTIQSTTGTVNVVGNGNTGILVEGSQIESEGNIDLTGDGNGSDGNNDGILLSDTATITANGTAEIILNGSSGTGNNSRGIASINNSEIISDTGDISITGNNQVENSNSVFMSENTIVESNNNGDISITGNQNIDSSNVRTAGGNITVNSTAGNVNSQGILATASTTGNSGIVTVNASENITINNIDTSTTADNNTTAGNINIDAGNTIILNGDIAASSASGEGGSLDFNSPVQFNQNTTIIDTTGETNGGNINFTNSVEGTTTNNNNITINSGSGDVSFNDTVGNQTSLGNLNINSDNTTVFNNSVNASSVTTDAAGTLQLNGDVTTSSNIGQTYNDTVTISDNVILTADELNFSSTVTGNNIDLTLQPFTTTQPITLGENNPIDTNSLDLTATELNLLQNGFSNIIIGGDNNSSSITLAGDTTFQDPVTLRSPVGDGTINTTEFTIIGTDNATVNLEANQAISTGNIINDSRTISITSNSGNIDTTAGIINTSSTLADGGVVDLNAAGNIIIGSINLSTTSPTPESRAGTLSLNTNETITLIGNIEASATAGEGSDLIVNQNFDITQPTLIRTAGNARSGNISFNQPINGNNILAIDAGDGIVNLQSTIGNTQPLTELNITASEINTNADITVDGDVRFNALENTNIRETLTIVNPSTLNITANQNITSENINNPAGIINLTSVNGTIDTSGGTLSTRSTTENGGNINLNAVENLILGNIDLSTASPSPVSQAGILQLNTAQNNIILRGNINTSATTGQASSLSFNSPVQLENSVILNTAGSNSSGLIRFDNVINDTTGNNILTLTAGTGNVDLNGVGSIVPPEGINITAETVNNTAALTVGTAGLDINANTVVNLNDTVTSNGDINIVANEQINTENLNTTANITPGGDILVNSNSGAITTGNLSASGTTGGEITIIAETAITAGDIEASGSVGDGGNIILDPVGDVEVGYINAEGGSNGTGGNVAIESTGRFFRATNTFQTPFSPTGNASISTASPTGGGSITIRHAGGELTTPIQPFQVGNASVNGTSGAISTGTATIAPAVILPDSTIQGNINIETDDVSSLQTTIEQQQETSFNSTQTTIEQQLENPLNDENLSTTINNEILAENQSNDTGITFNVGDGTEIKLSSSELLDSNETAFQGQNIDLTLLQLEQSRTKEFEEFFEIEVAARDRETVQKILQQVETETDEKYGIVYVVSRENQLEIILLPASGSPIRRSVTEANQEQFLSTVRQLQINLIRSRSRNRELYKAAAKQLYEWLITPIETDLEQLGITTMLFSFDAGFRSLPMGALWDGQQFLAEKYNYSLIPSSSLINTEHSNLNNAKILVMGASTFEEQNPLPAVPIEIDTILQLWQGQSFLNEAFTLENLKNQRQESDFSIVHLATHADFQSGTSDNSYIQLWDQKLSLTQLPLLNWGNPPVELLVLSACRTAIGNREAELGFAGLALQSGVKSAIASLWYVNDQGTLALMSQFYADLKQTSIKAAALRQAQLEMIRGNIRIENNQLITNEQTITLPPEFTELANEDLSHPYYWAGFTVIGTPW
ncbi:MAG: CHAT domain-containing protein [Microcoleaceae cyanobacterium]